MKGERQAEILNIITQKAVETQEQLLAELGARGIAATQATISRDIRELHLVKVQTATGAYRYAPSDREPSANPGGRLRTIFRESVVTFESAQNLVVVKTMPGMAQAAAAALDGMEIPDLVGSLGGDDTVLLILRTTGSAERFCAEMRAMLD